MLVTLTALLALAAPPKVVVLDAKADAKDAALAALATQGLAEAFGGAGVSDVVTVAEAKALLDTKAQNDLLGCDDPRCAKELGNVLAADVIVASVFGVVGDTHHLAITVLDAKEARVLDRSSVAWPAKGKAVDAAKPLALRAFNEAAREGDQSLAELRTAFAIDELDESGAAQANAVVQTCVQGLFTDAGIPVKRLDAAAGALGKSRADALAALSGKDVDVVVFGTAKSTLVGKVGTRTAMRTGFTFEIVKIDTGDVLASTSASPMQSAATKETATELAGKLACQAVKPALDAALARRVERGSRITVTVPVVAGAGVNIAEAALAALRAQPTLIARATLKNVTDKEAVIDVVARAGDAVAVGLALERATGGGHVTALGPTRFTFVP